MGKENNIKETVEGILSDIAEKRDKAMENSGQMQESALKEPGNSAETPEKEFKEITLKFGKGCVGEEFTGKDGKQYREIRIPNADKNDQRPWQTFVVKANRVHENQYGKGMWTKLPAEGHTTVHRSVVLGEKPDGKKEWGTEKNIVSNADLKKMVEFYKDRDSLKDKLSEKKTAAMQGKAEKPKEQAKAKDNVL